MADTPYSVDLVVWREGTSTLKGAIRQYNQYTFGTVRTMRTTAGTIGALSLSAFGRSNRWDMVWVESGALYYSSIYDYSEEPWLDLNNPPATVATYGDLEQFNPSLVKTGSNLTVAWETYYGEINKRNVKIVQITPSPTYGYPTIGTATTFTNSGSSSHYYTPSISSHSNNNLSLSWRNGTSTIFSATRVGGSWQAVTTLGIGVDPGASERISNTQNSSLHFRRGTSLPYELSAATITTGGMQKSGGIETVFAGEGREILFSSDRGTSSFLMLNATTGTSAIPFTESDDSKSLVTESELRNGLKTEPFISSGDVTMELYYKNSGETPPLRKVRVLLEEVNANGSSLHTLGIAKEYEGIKTSRETVAFTVPKTENPIRIIIDPVLRNDSMRVEVSKWYVIDTSEESLEKSGEEKQQAKIPAPAVLDLLQNYPNPFNPVTTFEFTVPKDGNATLVVFNSLGQNVATLFDGFAQSGYVQKAVFNGTRLSSGVYFSRLVFEGKTVMKKLLLMK
ncbi:MAG: T9SS type A sorting domain-containing protein [Bacteroidota bacterium]